MHHDDIGGAVVKNEWAYSESPSFKEAFNSDISPTVRLKVGCQVVTQNTVRMGTTEVGVMDDQFNSAQL